MHLIARDFMRRRLGFGLLYTVLLTAVAVGLTARASAEPYTAIGKYEADAAGRAPRTRDVSTTLTAMYQAAIADAAVAEASEISRDLTALTDANPQLLWRGEGSERQVLVVTWTGWTGYNASVGSTTTLSREVWVTVVPEVKVFCATHAIGAAQRTLRLEQLIGLPPGDGNTTFVEFWVSPDDLFRPSADPEVTDSEAGLGWPRSARYVSISTEFRSWYENLKATSYGPTGYPWTSLGYTYDWGNPVNPVGLSEFVIRAGAVVGVESALGNDDYFAGPAAIAGPWTRYP